MKRILVVEPDESIRTTMVIVLQQEGFAVTAVDSTEKALSYLVDECSKSIKPNLIITEMVMPEMDGLKFIDTLKETEEFKEIPVIIVATCSTMKAPEGMPLLKKPFHIEELLDVVNRYTC